nr:hypothetical protein [uncultured bacterium]
MPAYQTDAVKRLTGELDNGSAQGRESALTVSTHPPKSCSIGNRSFGGNDTQWSEPFQMWAQHFETLLRDVARRLRDCGERVHTQKCAT